MSMELTAEPVCYVNCNYCNTILAVNVPYGSMFTIVTVRCGHCSNLLSVNMGALLQSVHLQDFQVQKHQCLGMEGGAIRDNGSSSKCNRYASLQLDTEQPKMPPIRLTQHLYTTHDHAFLLIKSSSSSLKHRNAPEKRQRVPSAYNRFIKEEIQRIKANNPEISHREAFSTAAKNWAHFPHIHFGLRVESNKQAKLDHPVARETTAQKSLGF